MIKEDPKKLYRAKFFKFHENRRPPYYGTWRKKSETVRPRKPFGLDTVLRVELLLIGEIIFLELIFSDWITTWIQMTNGKRKNLVNLCMVLMMKRR